MNEITLKDLEEKYNKIIDEVKKLDEVIEVNRLEEYFLKNEDANNVLEDLLKYQKQMVVSKYYDLDNNYELNKEMYDRKKEELYDQLFVNEYLDALDISYQMLLDIVYIIEERLKKDLT